MADMLTADPPRPPGSRRPLRRLVLVIALVALAGAGVVVVDWFTSPPPRPRAQPFVVPHLDVTPGAAAPQGRPAPVEPDLTAWADRLSAATDIPARTLLAYVNAEITTSRTTPACNLTWTTLAGIGRVESHHGRYNGTRIDGDGRLSKPIIGIPLDGSPGVKAIPDTDGGRLDGDTRWDRAVGPMQFLPATWARWSLPESANPQDVDDATLTAARYLCASGGDLATGEGWWKAVLTYNQSARYGREVFSGAEAYARKAAEINR